MKKLVVLLCALLALGSSAQALEVSAPSALLMEKETGTVLFAKDEHAKLEPASVTKVMTLLLTMEAIDAGQLHYDDVVTASAHACSMGGSQIWLKENEQMTVSDMLKAVSALYDRIVDENLLIRRLSISANKLLPEVDVPKDEAEQLDLFTDYAAKEQREQAD